MKIEKCLLCKEGKLYHIKSHLTPAGISENTFGERNKELIYTIDPVKKTIDKYYGPQHPQTETTEVKVAPNSRKGIFCKDCENKFGNYESEVQDSLNELVNSLGKGGYKIHRTDEGVKYLQLNIHANILITFFQSIVWRQCIEQILDEQDNPLGNEDLESLRTIVLKNISISPKDILEVDLSQNPKMSIFTTYNTSSEKISTYANPSPINSNPLLFLISPVNLLYWISNNVSDTFSDRTKINKILLSNELLLDKSRLAIISTSDWTSINSMVAKVVAKQFKS